MTLLSAKSAWGVARMVGVVCMMGGFAVCRVVYLILSLVVLDDDSKKWLIVAGDFHLGCLVHPLVGVFGLGWMLPPFCGFVTSSGG